MSTTTSHESRQARRWRERQQRSRPVPEPCTRTPYVLLCRCEDDRGDGAWVMTDVHTPEEGDDIARDLQAAPADILGEMHLRCELVVNTPEALQVWSAASIKRRDAARRFGEVLR